MHGSISPYPEFPPPLEIKIVQRLSKHTLLEFLLEEQQKCQQQHAYKFPQF